MKFYPCYFWRPTGTEGVPTNNVVQVCSVIRGLSQSCSLLFSSVLVIPNSFLFNTYVMHSQIQTLQHTASSLTEVTGLICLNDSKSQHWRKMSGICLLKWCAFLLCTIYAHFCMQSQQVTFVLGGCAFFYPKFWAHWQQVNLGFEKYLTA